MPCFVVAMPGRDSLGETYEDNRQVRLPQCPVDQENPSKWDSARDALFCVDETLLRFAVIGRKHFFCDAVLEAMGPLKW